MDLEIVGRGDYNSAMDNQLAELLAEETELRFNRFDNAMAWKLGSWIVDKARKEGLRIAVGITRGGQRLFHYAFDGTSKDNDEWVDRKVRTVYRFGHSSFFLGCKLASEKKTATEKYYVDEREYAFHGGSFPIFVKGTGLVGTLTISGLAQDKDHALCVEALRHILRKDPKPNSAT